ncbi:MAG TPA: hypothetical protein VNO26_10300 [Candidatus Limnocylindria bacterium]|nr:hypothetical protein [Candidatus Limnocylindria bacterium]
MRWRVWIAALLVCPVPYGGIEHGWVPPVWLLAMALLSGSVVVVEGGKTPAQIAAVFGVQAVLASTVLWLASAGAVAAAQRVFGPTRARLAARSLLGMLVALALFPVYRSPIAHTPGWTTLAGLWR